MYFHFVHGTDLPSNQMLPVLLKNTTSKQLVHCPSRQKGQLLSAVSGGALRGKKRNIAEALAEARADALQP